MGGGNDSEPISEIKAVEKSNRIGKEKEVTTSYSDYKKSGVGGNLSVVIYCQAICSCTATLN